MASVRVRSTVAVVCLGAGLLLPVAAPAAVYPSNQCVSTKMKLAGTYCNAVLKAWSMWDKTQDTTKRDAKLALATAKLDLKWGKADSRALDKGVLCNQTTVSAATMRADLDATLTSIITSVNTGLNLGVPAEARCGAALLTAAANKCRGFLLAESKFVKHLEKDPDSLLRNQRKATAISKFHTVWAKPTSIACPTAATEAGIEALIDGLNDAAVLSTTVSPTVSDTSFDIISPSPTLYEKRLYTPVCSRGTPYSFFVKRGSVNKLLMYYQGGGACWDYFTCQFIVTFKESVDLVGDNPSNGTHVGLDDQTNPNNPFKDWNVVFVPYCSGDVHLGDAEATYTSGANSVTIQHRGFANAKVAEKWAREHFVNPEQVFVTGSSAGAYGALLHGAWLERVYPASDINVLGDAGNGVITEDFRTVKFPLVLIQSPLSFRGYAPVNVVSSVPAVNVKSSAMFNWPPALNVPAPLICKFR